MTIPQQLPDINWDRFISTSPYRMEVLDSCLSPKFDYAQTMRLENAMLAACEQHLNQVHGLTSFQVFLLWEHWVHQYRRMQVQSMLAQIESSTRPRKESPDA